MGKKDCQKNCRDKKKDIYKDYTSAFKDCAGGHTKEILASQDPPSN